MAPDDETLPASPDSEDHDSGSEDEGVGAAAGLPEEEAVSEEDETALPEPVEAVLERIPPEERDKVRSLFLGMSQFIGPMPHPLFGKMNEEHLDKLIEGADKDNERSYEDREKRRGHIRALSFAGMGVFLVASGLFLWMDQIALLERLVELGVVFGGGIGIGVGFLRRGRT